MLNNYYSTNRQVKAPGATPGREEAVAPGAAPMYDMGVITHKEGRYVGWAVHHVTVTVWTGDFLTPYNEYFKWLYGDLIDTGRGAMGYKHRYTAMDGMIDVLWSEGLRYHTIQIHGKGMECITHEALSTALLSIMGQWGLRFTRVDLAIDDLSRTVDISTVYECVQSNLYRSPSRRDSIVCIYRPFGRDDDGNGSTLTLGSRSSDRYLRIYDRRGFVRFELECKGRFAEVAGVELFLHEESEKPSIISGIVRDYIDFLTAEVETIRRASGGRLVDDSYHPYLALWWIRILDNINRIYGQLVRDPLDLTMGKRLAWIKRSVVVTLALIDAIYGRRALDDLILQGRARLYRSDRAIAILEYANGQ